MVRPGPDPAQVTRVRELADAGKTPREISDETGVPLRTVQRWLGGVQGDVRRLPDGQGSRVTRWRQRKRAGPPDRPQA